MHAALSLAFNPQMMGATNMTAVTYMAPIMSSGGGGNNNYFTVHASGNVTESNEKLGDIVSRAG
jgi:hypothetical protein